MATYEKPQVSPPQVFLSFRGAELRQSFIAHLEMALKRNGVNVYDNGMMIRGADLVQPIEESRIALVIFTKSYTESRWCLDELVKIKERVEEGKLMVIPVFYEVSPSHVKRLEGDFGLNLWNLGNRTSDFDRLKKWKEALDFVSSKVGLMFNEKRNESTFIHEIVNAVKSVLTSFPRDDDDDDDDDVLGGRNPDAESKNREEKKQEVVSSSSTDPRHQVFINFRGAELRGGFFSHLLAALEMQGVSVLVDVNLPRGEVVGNLVNRIEETKIALVIFSDRYTESAWCLQELVKIKELMDKDKLEAIPIFYKVEPSQVRDLDGVFGKNFWNLWRMQRDRHIIKWKEALRSMASMSGFHLSQHGCNESEIITQIVEEVLHRLSQGDNPSPKKAKRAESPPTTGETYHNVGMEQLEQKLEFDSSDDTRIIGVAGMPGIGKTTLAMMLYAKWNHRFLRCAPLLDIRNKSEEYGPEWLRKTFLELLLEGKVPKIGDGTTHGSVKAELLTYKFFALLDDVSDKTQLAFLLGGEQRDWIKKGSKIIITTRDKSLLEGFADDSYVVPGLNDDKAFQLFKYHAFSDKPTSSSFLRRSRMFVDYARGHPLTLTLLGKELNGKDAAEWVSKLEMVTRRSSSSVVFATNQLRLSEKQEDVLLDIVHFFKSEDEYFVRSLLDSGDPDSSDAVSEVKDLVNKFLITTTCDGRVEINFPLYTFSTDPGSPTRWLRLCNSEDIINELLIKTRKSDAKNVRGIFLDTSKLENGIFLDKSAFADMPNLRYMKIYDSCCSRQCKKQDCNKLDLADGLEFPLEEVRYLHWVKFPLEELPPDFRPENLVDLRLPYSNITRVWEGQKDTPRLKWVDLSYSKELVDLCALSKAAVNLQRLNLEGCTSLEELPREIQNMKSLVFLNLRGCISLWSLEMTLSSLETLILSDCSSLEEFQLVSESLEFLHLDGTAIRGLPQGIENHLQRLVVLNLKNCKMLESLPNSLTNLESLDKLILSGCSKLRNLPDVKKHLQVLLFDGTGAKEMPSISCPASGDDAFLQTRGSHCSVREWPCGVNLVYSLRRLCLSGNDFLSLQPDLWKLYNLKWLDVKQCKKLRSIPMLPPRLECFEAHGCDSLETVAKPLAFLLLSDQSHATFNFSNCNKLDRDAKDNIVSYTRWRSQLVLGERTLCSGGLVSEAPIGTCFPGWEVPAWFSHREYGSLLETNLPPHWCDNKFTGIGLCAVIVFDGGYHNQRTSVLLKCNFEFKNEDGSSNRFSCTVGGWSQPNDTPLKPVPSHVFIGFTTRLDINKISEEDDKENCVSTTTIIEFQVTDGMEKIKGCEVVKCGFSLVYAPEENRKICQI